MNQTIRLTVGRAFAITALGFASLLASLWAPAAAQAATWVYAVNRTIVAGTSGSVVGQITTDGSVGSLATSNITDWALSLDDGEGHGALLLDPTNSVVYIWGSLFTATPSDLSFDFSGSNGGVLFQSPGLGGGQDWWCLEGVASLCTLGGAGESVNRLGAGLHIPGSNSLIGTTGLAGALPEPPLWALALFALVALLTQRALGLKRQRPTQDLSQTRHHPARLIGREG